MTGPALGITCAAVTCLTWGVADYLAALISRRVGETGALLRIQLIGVPIMLIGWAVFRPPFPSADTLAWITAAAGCFLVGYLAFFNGLRVGAISLVSPISSAGSAVPVLAAIALFGETPSPTRLGGIALTLVGIWVLLADPGAISALAREGRRRGIRAGVITLLAWGSGTALLLPAVKTAGAFASVATLRLEVLALITAWWFITRGRPLDSGADSSIATDDAPANRIWRLVTPAAVLDLTAFFAYGVALRDAPAAVAAPLASAYPLVTILIARRRLHERLTQREWLGVGLTLLGVGLIGAGCCDAP